MASYLRQPLSSMTDSAANARGGRASIGVRAVAKDDNRRMTTSMTGRASIDRRSMAPSAGGRASVGRRSSIGSSRQSMAPKQDPRPLKSAAYTKESIHKLYTFLVTNAYPSQLSEKQLGSLTQRDVLNIFQFLFSKWDPACKFTSTFALDHFPHYLKSMGYQFQLQKSVLMAVNAPTSIPIVMGMFAWMVEMVQYKEQLESSPTMIFGVGDNDEKNIHLWNYTRKAYIDYLDEKEDPNDQSLINYFQERAQTVQAEIATIKGTHEGLVAEIGALKSKPNQLADLAQKRTMQETDIAKLQEYLGAVRVRLEREQQQIAKIEQEHAMLLNELETVNREKAALQDRVANQELSPADAARLTREAMQLQQELDTLQNNLRVANAAALDAEVTYSRSVEELNRAVQAFSAQANAAHLVRADDAKAPWALLNLSRPVAANFELEIHPGAGESERVLSLDVDVNVKAVLDDLRNACKQRVQAYQGQQLTLKEQIDRAEEEAQEKNEEVKALDARARKAEEKIKESKAAADEEVKRMKEETDATEESIMKLKSASAAGLAESQKQLAAVQAQYKATKAQYEAEQGEANKAVIDALDAMAQHKQEVRRKLGVLDARTNEIYAEINGSS